MKTRTHIPRPRNNERRGPGRIAAIGIALALLTGTASTPAFAESAGTPEHETVIDTRAGTSAAPSRIRPPSRIQYTYVILSRTHNWTNKSRQLGICKVHAGAGGGTCTISTSYSTTTGVTSSFNISKSIVAANIGIQFEKTVSGSVSWTSPKAKAGSSFKAWAVGERVTYKIKKWKVTKVGTRTVRTLLDTSPTLVSFEPVKGFAVGQ